MNKKIITLIPLMFILILSLALASTEICDDDWGMAKLSAMADIGEEYGEGDCNIESYEYDFYKVMEVSEFPDWAWGIQEEREIEAVNSYCGKEPLWVDDVVVDVCEWIILPNHHNKVNEAGEDLLLCPDGNEYTVDEFTTPRIEWQECKMNYLNNIERFSGIGYNGNNLCAVYDKTYVTPEGVLLNSVNCYGGSDELVYKLYNGETNICHLDCENINQEALEKIGKEKLLSIFFKRIAKYTTGDYPTFSFVDLPILNMETRNEFKEFFFPDSESFNYTPVYLLGGILLIGIIINKRGKN